MTSVISKVDVGTRMKFNWSSWTPHRILEFGHKARDTWSLPVSHLLVPIRTLGVSQRAAIGHHLSSLSLRDRYLRFGYTANDQQIEQYVATLDFERDEIFGIYDRSLLLIAVTHLALVIVDATDNSAEFGVSVLPHARARGFGSRLFEHAAISAQNRNVTRLFIHALSENTPMIKIAQAAGARVERHGCESDAYLQLAAPTMKSRLTEFFGERFARVDYQIKERGRWPSSLSQDLNRLRHGAMADQ